MNDRTEKTAPEWHLRLGERTYGPFPQRLVSRFILQGRILAGDELSRDGREWQPARSLRALFPEEMARLNPKHAAQILGQAAAGGADPPPVRHRVEGDAAGNPSGTTQSPGAFRHYAPRTAVALVVLGALVAAVAYLGTERRDDQPDCSAPAAPGVNWRNCRKVALTLRGTSLTEANLQNGRFPQGDFRSADLNRANLGFADLSGVRLERASLKGANLKGANLRESDLAEADLTGADLSYADLSGARVAGVNWTQVNLSKTIWTDGTVCPEGAVGTCR